MFIAFLAIILGLFIIYFIFNRNFCEGLTIKGNGKNIELPISDSVVLEGTQVYIFNLPEESEEMKKGKGKREKYSDYETIYKKTVNRYPLEDIRFDLLTPVPYSDAFIAPMGRGYKPTTPKKTLDQVTYPQTSYPYQLR